MRHHCGDVSRRYQPNPAGVRVDRTQHHERGDWAGRSRSMSRANWGRIWTVLGPFLILVFVNFLFAALLSWKDSRNDTEDLKHFFSLANFVIVLTQTVIVAIGALGMTMIIVSGGIDLSVGSVIALTSVLGAVMIRQESPLPWVVAATILAGGCIGLVNRSEEHTSE